MADNKKVNSPAEENKKAETKATKSQDNKPNFFVRASKKIVKFSKDTVGELKKVVWTSRSEVWKSLQLVIASVVAISVAIALIDLASSSLINFVAGLIG